MTTNNADALFKAIENDDLTKVIELIESNAELNQVNELGHTPLLLAIRFGKVKIAKILLNAGADSSCVNEHLIGGLIHERKSKSLLFLIDQVGIDVNQKFEEDDDTTALIEAAQMGLIKIVKKLVESGADVNAISRKNDFALMNAACQGHQEIYEYLAPLTSAKLRQLTEEIFPQGLIKKQRRNNKLLQKFILGAATGDLETVLSAIQRGVDINAFGDNETTALFIAANWGRVAVVNALIEAGADVNLGQEDNGETPLMIAASRIALSKHPTVSVDASNYIRVMKLLIEAGADVNAKTDEGWTALMAAANAGSIEAVKLLLQAKADVNAQDEDEDTAFSYAQREGYRDIVQLLQEARAAGK